MKNLKDKERIAQIADMEPGLEKFDAAFVAHRLDGRETQAPAA